MSETCSLLLWRNVTYCHNDIIEEDEQKLGSPESTIRVHSLEVD